jgi:molybdopterin molybdotransferase
MVSVEEASRIIRSTSIHLQTAVIPIVESVERVLAEDVVADRDLPPFDRVAMDGIALVSSSFKPGVALSVEGTQRAGTPRMQLQNPSGCIEVMTGAVLPLAADAVVRYEDTAINNGVASINLQEVNSGMNIHSRGADATKGMHLLGPGQLVSPAEVALLASVGKKTVRVFDFPKTAIISTGDELVEIDETPLPHQIRRSNVYSLQSALHEMGWTSDSFHLGDNPNEISEKLRFLLGQYEVLILSGGVSKGKYDYIPESLSELGLQMKFHNISQKPGKPFWFGSSDQNIAFALPGNPVSTFLNFYRYIKPWMLNLMGVDPPLQTAILSQDVEFTPSLTYFLQVRATCSEGRLMADPVPGGGSGDFVNLKDVDGFLELPAVRSLFSAGEIFPFIPFR